jgi:hypothetical protein
LSRVPNVSTSPRELHSEDLAKRPYQVLDMTAPQVLSQVSLIESVDSDVLPESYADKLAFNEEPVELRIEPRPERNAAGVVDVSVNGDRRWLPVGIPIRIQRKFVEVLARAQPFNVATEHGTAMEENPRNLIHRTPFRAVPFSILHDPNPRGAAWLNKISYEA